MAKLDEGYDLVCGWRQRRQDKFLLRKVPSWVANRIIRRLTGVPITDNGCSLKAYRRDLLDRISLYAEQHRFIPALSASVGARITEMPVRHHARRFGESKYGISRTVKVLVDLLHAEDDHDLPLAAAAGLRRWRPCRLVARRGALRRHVGRSRDPVQSGEGRRRWSFPAPRSSGAGAAFYLVMLGLVAEVALSSERETRERHSERLGGSLTWGHQGS